MLEIGGRRQPSDSDLQNVKEIVGLLGSLPLAIDQAGAFMRSRHKNPKEYKDIYLGARSEVLDYKSRLADYEGTVVSTWKVNFKQIERESKAATNLLLLFWFLEPSRISKAVLHRGCMSQNRRSENGEVTEIQADFDS